MKTTTASLEIGCTHLTDRSDQRQTNVPFIKQKFCWLIATEVEVLHYYYPGRPSILTALRYVIHAAWQCTAGLQTGSVIQLHTLCIDQATERLSGHRTTWAVPRTLFHWSKPGMELHFTLGWFCVDSDFYQLFTQAKFKIQKSLDCFKTPHIHSGMCMFQYTYNYPRFQTTYSFSTKWKWKSVGHLAVYHLKSNF